MKALEASPSMGLLNLERRLKREWIVVLLQEEVLWMQKLCVNRLRFGDQNNKFFHTSTLVRRRRNKVEMLKNEEEEWVVDDERLKDTAVRFYSNCLDLREQVGMSLSHDPSHLWMLSL